MEQLENIDLGPTAEIRARHLMSWMVLRVECSTCGHLGLVDPAWLKGRRSAHTRLIDLHFRCTECGNARLDTCQICKLPRNW